jgi:aryl-alcohol dehydrogenase
MLNVVQPTSDSTVVIIGTGVVGLAALMSLKMSETPPHKIIVADIVPQRLETAKSLGATNIINSRETLDLRKELMSITNDEGVDGAIDTTGRPEIVEALLSSTGKKGKVVTVGVGDVCARSILLPFLTSADRASSPLKSHTIYTSLWLTAVVMSVATRAIATRRISYLR